MPCHLLYCDYEGEFKYSEALSRIGYVVDHVRPEALRHVNVGDHQVFVFVYSQPDNAQAAGQTAEKLKMAELPSEIVLLNMAPDSTINPSEINGAVSVNSLLDELDRLVGTPFPPSLKTAMGAFRGDREKEVYRQRIAELEQKVHELEQVQKVAVGQEDLKPKLQALLKGQKLQFQTETERLKIQLSELEAKLIDREAKLKELTQK